MIVGAGTALHVVLGRWVASPWLMPDLTLISMVLAMTLPSQSLLGPALLAGFFVMLSTPQQPLLLGGTYVGAGWLIQVLALRWDLTDSTLQQLTVGAAEAGLLAMWLMLNAQVTMGLLLLAGMKLVMTVVCVPLVSFVMRRLIPHGFSRPARPWGSTS